MEMNRTRMNHESLIRLLISLFLSFADIDAKKVNDLIYLSENRTFFWSRSRSCKSTCSSNYSCSPVKPDLTFDELCKSFHNKFIYELYYTKPLFREILASLTFIRLLVISGPFDLRGFTLSMNPFSADFLLSFVNYCFFHLIILNKLTINHLTSTLFDYIISRLQTIHCIHINHLS
jgi:hypothetical protein